MSELRRPWSGIRRSLFFFLRTVHITIKCGHVNVVRGQGDVIIVDRGDHRRIHQSPGPVAPNGLDIRP